MVFILRSLLFYVTMKNKHTLEAKDTWGKIQYIKAIAVKISTKNP